MKQNKIYIIAEIGVNHNGSLQHKDLILQCKISGADKVQTYSSEDICDNETRKANYQIKINQMNHN